MSTQKQLFGNQSNEYRLRRNRQDQQREAFGAVIDCFMPEGTPPGGFRFLEKGKFSGVWWWHD
jgi:hypothetical protein